MASSSPDPVTRTTIDRAAGVLNTRQTQIINGSVVVAVAALMIAFVAVLVAGVVWVWSSWIF